MKLNSAWRKIQWSIRQRGILGTLKKMLSRGPAEPEKVHPFDAKYGTDTGGVIGGSALGGGHANDAYITAYAGMPPSRLEATLERWLAEPPLVPTGEVTFIDIGCGKGRVVLIASRRSFGRVLGVELDPSLVATARTNLRIWQNHGEAVTPPEIVCADATEFHLPKGHCLLYLANPFGPQVLRVLLEKLEGRAQAGEGSIDLIYQNAEHRDVFHEFPTWRLLWDEAFPLSHEDAAAEPVYRAEDRCLAWRREAR